MVWLRGSITLSAQPTALPGLLVVGLVGDRLRALRSANACNDGPGTRLRALPVRFLLLLRLSRSDRAQPLLRNHRCHRTVEAVDVAPVLVACLGTAQGNLLLGEAMA